MAIEFTLAPRGCDGRLEAALGTRYHADHARVKPTLAGKQVTDARFPMPEQYPSLRGRFGPRIDYAAESVAQSCMHCHQIGEAERLVFRLEGEPVPDEALLAHGDEVSVYGTTLRFEE